MQTRTIILSGFVTNNALMGIISINGQSDISANLKLFNVPENQICNFVFCLGQKVFVAHNVPTNSEYNFFMSDICINDEIKACIFDESQNLLLCNNLPDEEIEKMKQNLNNEEEINVQTSSLDSQSCVLQQEKEENDSFFDEIEQQFDTMMQQGSVCEEVQNLIPNSQWVYIQDQETEPQCIIGKIFDEENNIRYICCGMPAKNFDDVGQVNLEYSQWLPLNPQDPEGRGYYITYQDAKTGENIKLSA